MSARPPTLISGFGSVSVIGRIRIPSPAANTMAVLGTGGLIGNDPVICGRPLGKRVFDGLIALVGCGHMSGLWCGIGPLALMIFDSPGPYHCGELGSS